MAYPSTDRTGNIVRTELQPPFETLVSTISRCSGYVVLALVTAGLFLIVF